MSKNKEIKTRDIVGIILFIFSLILLFTVSGAQLIFELLPRTTVFITIGVSLPYFILLISLHLLIWRRLKQVLKKNDSELEKIKKVTITLEMLVASSLIVALGSGICFL